MLWFIVGAILGATLGVAVVGIMTVDTCDSLREENAKLKIHLKHRK